MILLRQFLFAKDLKYYTASVKSCRVQGSEYIFEPKISNLTLKFDDVKDANFCVLKFKRLSGNGFVSIFCDEGEIKTSVSSLKECEFKIRMYHSKQITVKRFSESTGEISLLSVFLYNCDNDDFEKEKDIVLAGNKWKNIINKFSQYDGIRVADSKLYATENATLKPANIISSIITDPTDRTVIADDCIKFLTACEITDIILNDETNTQPVEIPFVPHINEPPVIITNNNVLNKTLTTQIYDSILDTGLASVVKSPDVQVIKNTENNFYIRFPHEGNISIPISLLKPHTDYTFICSAYKVGFSGNGKFGLKFLAGNIESDSRGEAIFIAVGHAQTFTCKFNSGYLPSPGDSYVCQLFRPEGSVGDLIINRIHIIEEINVVQNKPVLPVRKSKKITIVIPSYNNSKWYEWNLNSACFQNYDNYKIIYTDDASQDGTADLVSKFIIENKLEDKVTLIRNKERKGALNNLYDMIWNCDNDTVIITLDGDDALANNDVLQKISDVYQDPSIWITYGSYIDYPMNTRGCAKPYGDEIIGASLYRRVPWQASHLRTFYAGLFKKIKQEDLMHNGQFYQSAWDLGMMFPMLEMAQFHSKYIDDILYTYNLENPINDHKVDVRLQANLGNYIRCLPRYQSISSITESFITFQELGKYGRIGNQMFQVAALLSLARDNNASAKVKWFCHYTGKYISSFFKHKVLDQDIDNLKIDYNYNEPAYSYNPISFQKNMNLHGYFQSDKYFEHNKEWIQWCFEPADNIIDNLKTKYNNILESNTCSIHIRRGDFVGNPVHSVCDLDYYTRAINRIKQMTNIDNFLVFSDDIAWCENNLGSGYIYVRDNASDVEDLFLMAQCKHNILSNSSFSWWASWLNKNPKKIVLVPSRWVANSQFTNNDIYRKDMIRI